MGARSQAGAEGFRSPTRDIERPTETMRVIYLEPSEAAKLLAGSFAFRDPPFVAFVTCCTTPARAFPN